MNRRSFLGMTGALSAEAALPSLRLFEPSELEEAWAEDARGSPSAAWTLSTFFERWYLPVVLQAKGVQAKTVLIYRDALSWWQTLVGDPPLSQVDEHTLGVFVARLRAATYRRSPTGEARPLSRCSQEKIKRTLRAVLYRTGPSWDPKRPAKELIAFAPHIETHAIRGRPKPCFTWEQAEAIVAAAGQMTIPEVLDYEPAAWWRVRLGLYAYTGLRKGTVEELRCRWLVDRSDGLWLEVPGWEGNTKITKTGEPIDVAVHPLLAAELAPIRASGRERISPWPHDERWFLTVHEKLQVRAGIPRDKTLSPHAWRRTHADQINRAGRKVGLRLAQEALGHADSSTTEQSYTDLVNELRRELPPLWAPKQAAA